MDNAKKLKKKMDAQTESDLNHIARIAIDHYYESYDPEYYERTGDLYKVFSVEITDESISLTYNYRSLRNHDILLRKYIFDYMFLQGYHGGAISGYGHPAEGIPWYRGTPKGSNKFAFWTTPAVQTDSPYEEMEANSQKYIDDVNERYQHTIVEPLQRSIHGMLEILER